jgi:hypothetical protein
MDDPSAKLIFNLTSIRRAHEDGENALALALLASGLSASLFSASIKTNKRREDLAIDTTDCNHLEVRAPLGVYENRQTAKFSIQCSF